MSAIHWKQKCSTYKYYCAQPALVSAGPWQGSDAMVSAECESITVVWRRSLQRGSRGRAPVGVQEASPPEAKCLLHFACPKKAANLPHY